MEAFQGIDVDQIDSLNGLKEVLNSELTKAGISIGAIVGILVVVILIKLILDWINFEQCRQISKIYKNISKQLDKAGENSDRSIKFKLEDFENIRYKTVYMTVLIVIHIIGVLTGISMITIWAAIIGMLMLYIPIILLTKGSGLTETGLKGCRIMTNIIFVWTIIKTSSILLVLLCGLGVMVYCM